MNTNYIKNNKFVLYTISIIIVVSIIILLIPNLINILNIRDIKLFYSKEEIPDLYIVPVKRYVNDITYRSRNNKKIEYNGIEFNIPWENALVKKLAKSGSFPETFTITNKKKSRS